jgi:hypothetical protein
LWWLKVTVLPEDCGDLLLLQLLPGKAGSSCCRLLLLLHLIILGIKTVNTMIMIAVQGRHRLTAHMFETGYTSKEVVHKKAPSSPPPPNETCLKPRVKPHIIISHFPSAFIALPGEDVYISRNFGTSIYRSRLSSSHALRDLMLILLIFLLFSFEAGETRKKNSKVTRENNKSIDRL